MGELANLLLSTLLVAFVCHTVGKTIHDGQDSNQNILSRFARSVAKQAEKTMELMIVADKNMVTHYGKEPLRKLLVDQGQILKSLFQDKSLSYPMTVAVTRIVLLEGEELAGAASIADLLDKFTTWAVKNNPVNDVDPLHVDNAILITRGGCADGCKLRGLASVGMCGRSSSQSVVKDSGLMSPITMAHEIAHNLGLDHDGSSGLETCPDALNIMSSGNVNGVNGFHWSKCSSKTLAANLASASSHCYDDQPTLPSTPVSTLSLPGQKYSADKQCQLAFSAGHTHCGPRKSLCTNLHCKRPTQNYCDMTSYPAAQGTTCGDKRWCIFGECVWNSTIPDTTVVNGGWSAYSPHGPCNRNCGGGVKWKSRTCTNPAPKNGGNTCVGESVSFYASCNMQACPIGSISFRAEQCKARAPTSSPTLDSSYACKLICNIPGVRTANFGGVQDGTSFYDSICVKGVLRKVGCDKVMDSGTVSDRCGVCGGDGSTCMAVKGQDMNTYNQEGQYLIATIPKGSSDIVVEELAPTDEYIGVKVGNSNALAYGFPTWTKRMKVAGADLTYTVEDYVFRSTLVIKGTINEDIRIFFVNYWYKASKGVKWQYFKPTDAALSPSEYAVDGTWGTCSKTCAGGTQQRKIICRRVDDKTQTGLKYCSSSAKPSSTQPCNTQACAADWVVHSWSPCTKPCGNGQRTRAITCSELRSDKEYHPVAESSCTKAKPTVKLTEVCNAIQCLAQRVNGEWGQCSTTCGEGTKTRSITCKRVNADGTTIVAYDLECDAMMPPAKKIEVCKNYIPCSGYAWKPTYGDCVASCGTGYKSMIAHCVDSTGAKVVYTKCLGTPFPAQQKCGALPQCPGVSSDLNVPEYVGLGCFRDTRPRRLPVSLANFRDQIVWSDMSPIVKSCAKLAASDPRKFTFFAVQFYGECYAGTDAVTDTYYTLGQSTSCYQGTGGTAVNYVYHFARLAAIAKLSPIVPFGCYNSKHTQGPPLIMFKQVTIDQTKSHTLSAAHITSKCAVAAAKQGFTVFGVQSDGKCWSAPGAEKTYTLDTVVTSCVSELGGADSHFVYKFITTS